jgi:outer membrane immunogenic protein
MRKFCLMITSAALAVITAPATAADLSLDRPIEGPTAGPPWLLAGIPFNWTGSYVGLNVGYAHSNVDLIAFGPGVSGSGSETMTGAVGGGQWGYNWQINNWLLGMETDMQASGLSGSVNYAGIAQTDNIPWFGTARARAGFAWDCLLFYGTGGVSYGKITNDLSGSVIASLFRNNFGWVAGGGVEVAILPRWSVRAEYLHLDLRDVSSVVGKVTVSSGNTADLARIGVNYRFGYAF